jgi:hypothetical protein
MDSLFAAMDARLSGEAMRIVASSVREGTLAKRVSGLVRQRATLFERIGPYKRSANIQRWRSAFLRDRHQNMQRSLRADLLQWLPELEKAPADLLEAADLVTSFDAWDRLRHDRQVSQKVAMAAVERTLTALLRAPAQRPRPRR